MSNVRSAEVLWMAEGNTGSGARGRVAVGFRGVEGTHVRMHVFQRDLGGLRAVPASRDAGTASGREATVADDGRRAAV